MSDIDYSASLPPIETPRLTLRQLLRSDVSDLYEIFSDAAVTQYWGFERFRTTSEAVALFDDIEQGRIEQRLFQWGITLKESGVLIGTATICGWDRQHRRAEIGFALRPAYWGRRLGLEAAHAIVQFGFTSMDLHRFEADADPRNTASIGIMKRLGFREEGYQRERYIMEGDIQDAVLFGLLRHEWQAAAGKSILHTPSGPTRTVDEAR